MADAMGAGKFTDLVDVIEFVRGTVVLDDVKRMPDRNQLGVLLDVLGELEQVTVETHRDLVGTANGLLALDSGIVARQQVRNVVDRVLASNLVGGHDKPQLQQIPGFAVHREARAVGAAMLAAIEHFDQCFANFVRALGFEQHACNSTHGGSSRNLSDRRQSLLHGQIRVN